MGNKKQQEPPTKDYFAGCIQCGVMNFFGIQLNENGLFGDIQKPEIFKKYYKGETK